MIEAIARGVVVFAAFYLVVLGLACLFTPGRAGRFLLAFAASPGVHFLEMAVRLLVGAALLVCAPTMSPPKVFAVVGGLLVGTTVVLLFVPWRWHRRFAEATVPRALRAVGVIGVASAAMGILLVSALFRTGGGPW